MTGKIPAGTSGTFNPMASNGTSKTEKALREHNVGPQKPGRPTAPQDRHSSSASAPRDLEFAPSTSLGYTPRDVLGRLSGHAARRQS